MTRSAPRKMHMAQTSALATAAVALVAALAAPHMALAQAPKSPADCRTISDFNLRGQCWDALDQASQKDAQVQKKHNFGLGEHPPSDAAVLPNKAEIRAREAQQKKEDVRELTLTLASVHDTPLGHLLLTSTDGAVWEQTDSDPVNNQPAAGDKVTITKHALGGFICQVSHYQSVRCQRDK